MVSTASSPAAVAPRLLLLGCGLGAASWRFRIEQYVPRLRDRGFAVDIAELQRPWPARLRLLASAARHDVVCVHRALLSPLELLCLRRGGARVLFDFDDAIMHRDSNHARIESRRRRRRFARMVRAADGVIAGNAYLAEWARRYGDRVVVLPTAIDLAEIAPPAAPSTAPVVGWIGTRPNLTYLQAFLPALRRLRERRPDVALEVVCDAALESTRVPVRNTRWSRADEAAALRRFQVGIMPLPDDAWTRGKCGVKILQYFAAGLPVVCSPVGANREIVEHGRNGFFAATDDEWAARVGELLDDPELRRRFGAAGRALVEQRYSTEVVLPRLVELLVG